MNAIDGIFCVGIVTVTLRAILHGVLWLPERTSTAIALGCALVIVTLGWKRLNVWSQPAKRASKSPTPTPSNRAARRKAHDKAARR